MDWEWARTNANEQTNKQMNDYDELLASTAALSHQIYKYNINNNNVFCAQQQQQHSNN